MKKTGPLVAGAAVAFATVIAVAPTASADTPRITQDKEVTFSCLGTDAGTVNVSPNTFKVTYPTEVAPGETFTVSVQAGEMQNTSRAIGRMTLDYALPTNATILGLNLAGGQKGLGGVAPSVTRVSATAKTTDAANGMAARIWGGASARYGTSSSGTSASGGITVAVNTAFQLPQLDIVMRAPAQVGANVVIGLPGANLPAQGGNGAANSTDLAWGRGTQCQSGANGAALATTTVGDLPAVLLPSTTTIAGGDRTLGPGQATKFSANVSTEFATPALTSGKVEFWDTTGNAKIGEATPNAAGLAELDHAFAPITAGSPDQVFKVEARYLGVDGDIAASTSAPVTVTNTSKPTAFHEVRLDLRAQIGAETDTEVPVTINAAIARPAGTPQDVAMVQLFRGDTPVGDPVALPAANEMTWTDTIARQPRTTTERYRVAFVAPVVIGYQQWDAVSQPVSVIVTGSDPSLDPPLTGDTGSLDMTSILGSLGNLFGTGS